MKKQIWKIKNGKLTFKDKVTNILDGAFSSSKLISVLIPHGVVSIGDFSFIDNDLLSVSLPDTLIKIGENAFSYNKLKKIEIPKSVRVIEKACFRNNSLTSVILHDGITKIEDYAFYENPLTNIVIPNSVKLIGKNVFNNVNVVYDGIELKKEYIDKYGTENIIKLSKLFRISSPKIIERFSREVIEQIPLDKESIKGYERNYKFYEQIKKALETKEKILEYNDIFKLCYILGLFKKGNDKLTILIKDMLNTFTPHDINKMFVNIRLENYKSGASDLIIKLFLENKLKYKDQIIIGRVYQVYEDIKKYTISRHKEIIRRKNAEIKKLDSDVSKLKQELDELKKNLKKISYDDICYYFENNNLDIRKGNENLRAILDNVSVHLNQKKFNVIQDLYEESLGVLKNIPMTKDKCEKKITYYWAKSDDIVNIMLGYIFKSCTKIGEIGEDIMRQSMINPDIVNLVIYDENKKVIGKATAYYNKNKKYILFNNALVKSLKTKDLEADKKRKINCLKAILRAISDVIEELKKQNVYIESVRMGMTKNDLSDVIKETGIEVKLEDLLLNYSYEGYEGNANGCEGQAVLYKDNMLAETGKYIIS